MLYAWLPNHLFEHFHLSLAQSGLNATLFLQMSSALGALLGGILGDKLSNQIKDRRLYIVATGLCLGAPFAAATFAAPSLLLFRLFAPSFGIFAGCVAANVFATLPEIVAQRNFGLATGLLNLAGGLGAGAAIFLVGTLHNKFTNAQLMLVGTCISMIAAAGLLIIVRSNFDRETNPIN